MAEEVEKGLSLPEGDNKVPAMAYGEMGYTGLTTLGGRVWDECTYELRWPYAYKTFKQMALDGAIHPSLDFVESKIAEASWVVRIPKKVPKELEAQLKSQKEFVEQVMNDMEHSWTAMIKDAASFNRYGFSTLEKVYRYRNKKYGSKYDDGRVGLRKIVGRSQGTIDEWEWKNKGRDIKGFWQRVVTPTDGEIIRDGWEIVKQQASQEFNLKFIPRYKFLLFRHNAENDSPVGRSPLTGVWQDYKLKQAYMESEAISVAQDANAFKILYLPPEYLVADADEDRKASFEMYKKMLEKAHQAKQSGFILPMLTDSEGKKMFEFEIKNISGTKSYDVNKIIERLTRSIQVGLFADVLSMGGNGGSYSLAEQKGSVLELAVKSRLNEIKDQLNHDLMNQLFEQNGWSTAGPIPYLDYILPNVESLDNKSKAYQRIKAVGLLPIVPAVVNQALTDLGIDYQVDDDMSTEDLIKLLDPLGEGMSSESGKGLEEGMSNTNGNDTSGSGDASISNSENA